MTKIEKAVADLEKAVAAKRDEIQEARAALEGHQGQPLTHDEAMARVEEYIQRKADEYRDGAGIAAFAAPEARPGPLIPAHDPEPALCFLFPDAIRERLAAELEAHTGEGKPMRERADEVAALRDRLLTLEQEEEQLIRQAEQAGLTIHRRPDADPRAVLA